MLSFLLVTITLASCTVVANGSPAGNLELGRLFPDGRIVGGEDTRIDDHPWQASLQVHGFAYCGASIIAREWVVTAGHCASYPASYTIVKAGTSYKYSGGSDHQAIRVITHEDYGTTPRGVPMNDVAVIKVGTPFVWDSTRRPITLFGHGEGSNDGVLSVITGWGAVREGGSSADILQMVKVPIVSKEVCGKAYTSYGGLPEGQICAAYPQGGKDACQGDSGGPLTIGGRLAGIVSWGNGCAKPGYPGVYTEVAAYRNWITDKVGV